MRRRSQLHGLMFRPSESSVAEYEKTVYSSNYAVRKEFKKSYQDHMVAMQIVAMSAKIYILNNWKRVKKWSDIEISIVYREKETYYYNHKDRKPGIQTIKSKPYERIIKRIEAKKKKEHNPVKKLSGAILDTRDGDFSVKINGKWHFWLDDEAVIVLADYIEKHVK